MTKSQVTKMEWKKEFDKKFKNYIKTMGVGQYEGIVNIGFKAADDVIKDFIENLLTLSESRVRGEEKLALAEAQLLGFDYGRWHRTDLEGLIESMGLTKKEWNLLNKNYDMTYLTDEDRREILSSLTKKEGE